MEVTPTNNLLPAPTDAPIDEDSPSASDPVHEDSSPEEDGHDRRYYLSDGNVVFMCEGVLYKIHKTHLTRKSEIFRLMFDIPQGAVVDGHDDAHPIVLHDRNIDFRHLLIFLYDQDEVKNPTLQYYISILHLSRKYIIPTGLRYARHNLPSLPDFTPAIQLRLARQYSILDWADAGFRGLVDRKLKDIDLEDAENMGIVAFHQLVQVHCKIQELNLGLAYNPPTVPHSPGCIDEPQCTRLWERAWWMGYAKHLLHPERLCDRNSILGMLDLENGILVDMGPGCLQNTCNAIWLENPFDEDQEYIVTAIEELKRWMAPL